MADYRDYRGKERNKFYKTKAWRSVRKSVLERDLYICQYCGRPDSFTVDHTTPLEVYVQGALEPKNLKTICHTCHQRKTAIEQRLYGTGKNGTLHNLSIRHDFDWWKRMVTKKKQKAISMF